jgi:hypothetical protein
MSVRRLLIVGNRVGHDIQRIVLDSSDKLKAQKQEFREMLRKRIDERHTQFIGEEASYKWEGTTAQTLGVRWTNIDMPMDERERRGILEEQMQRRRVPSYLGDQARTVLLEEGYQRDVGNGWAELEVRVPSDVIREQFMFDRVQENAGDADRIVVICGIIHSEKLAERFRDTGAQVEVEIWPSF